MEFELLNKWFDFIVETHNCSLDIIFYLKTSPEFCLERLIKRDRIEENKVDFNYLKLLHTSHEKWLNQDAFEIDSLYKPPLIVMVNGNEAEEIILEFFLKILHKLLI